MRPTVRSILIAASGLVLALLPALVDGSLWGFWIVFCCALLLAIAFDAFLSPFASDVRMELSAPATVYIGEDAAADLRVRVRGAPARPVDVTLDLSDLLAPVDAVRGMVPEEGLLARFPLVARRRGAAELERAWVRLRGPLGLVERTIRRPLAHTVTIVPNVMPTRRAALRFRNDRSHQAGARVERYRGDGTEFDSLREFVVGDEPRSIHWRATARHRTLLTRHHRAERNHQVFVALDTGHLMSEALAGGIPRIDHAVSAALLLAFVGLKTGDRVGLYSFGANAGRFSPAEGGMRHHRALLDWTSRIEYTDEETNFTLGLTVLAQKLRRRSLVVVLTDFVDTVTAELMTRNLGRLARKHVVVFTSLRDPQLRELSRAAPDNIAALNRSVVAGSYLRERDVVLRRLERLGLFTIDAEPGEIGTELINRYLDVKRRELV